MARRSSPNRSSMSELDLSLDASSIQDPTQAKLDELMALVKENKQQMSQLMNENARQSRGARPKHAAAIKAVSVRIYIYISYRPLFFLSLSLSLSLAS
ncbi:MAG: hypothetical protein KZQ70_12340 [gamma proteobacterium symbiont of Lucinoma myriamae]|nr:hypothetical protein [gamma proteobacterium symbiont of Lucinoma myriamae]